MKFHFFNYFKKSFMPLTILLTVTPFPSFTRIPDKRDLKGLYNAVIEEKQHLSPFHGFVWIESDLLGKYYEWGNANVIKDERGVVKKIERNGTDPTMWLILKLFHVVDGQLNATKVPTEPATYFSPEAIGKILSFIESLEGTDKKTALARKKELTNIMLSATDASQSMGQVSKEFEKFGNEAIKIGNEILQNPALDSVSKKMKTKYFNFTKGQWKKSLINLSAESEDTINALFEPYQLTPEEKTKYSNIFIDLTNQFKKLQQSQKEISSVYTILQNSAAYLAQMTIESLIESGHITNDNQQPLRYPHYTTHTIFLSLLYDKAESMDDFMAYFQQFSPEILKENAANILAERFADVNEPNKINEQIFARNRDDLRDLIKNNYEHIIFQAYDESLPIVPRIIPWNDVIIKGQKFANCGAATLMSFLRIIFAKVGVYDMSTRNFDANTMQETIKEYFTSRGISFDIAKMSENITDLQLFLEKYPNETIISGEEFHSKFTTLLSDIPGIKYLRRVKKDGSEKALKDNLLPAVHQTEHTTGTFQNLDDSWYLVEISGYPSTFVEVCNYFFGLNNASFEELCNTFEFEIKTGDEYQPKDINDSSIYANINKPKVDKFENPNLETTINNQTIGFQLHLNTGHVSIQYNQKDRPIGTTKSILSRLIPYFDSDYLTQNIISFYPNVKLFLFEKDFDQGPIMENQAMLQHLLMTRELTNLSFQSDAIKFLLGKNKASEGTLLGNFAHKLINNIITMKDDENAVEILFDLAQKDHLLNQNFFDFIIRIIPILNIEKYKLNASIALFSIFHNHEWSHLESQSLINTVTSITNLFEPFSDIAKTRIVINVLNNPQVSLNYPDELIPLLHDALTNKKITLRDINQIIIAVAQSEHILTPEEKILKLTNNIKLLTNFESVLTVFAIITKKELTELYPIIINKLNESKKEKWLLADYQNANNLFETILNQYPNIDNILTDFLNTKFKEYLSYPDLSSAQINQQKNLINQTIYLHRNANPLLKKIVEINYQNLYPIILQYFNDSKENIKIFSSLDNQIALLKFMIETYVRQNVITPLKELLDNCLQTFFETCLNQEAPSSEQLIPILSFIESLATPTFNASAANLKNMFIKTKTELENKIDEYKQIGATTENLEKSLEEMQKIEDPVMELIRKILEE